MFAVIHMDGEYDTYWVSEAEVWTGIDTEEQYNAIMHEWELVSPAVNSIKIKGLRKGSLGYWEAFPEEFSRQLKKTSGFSSFEEFLNSKGISSQKVNFLET